MRTHRLLACILAFCATGAFSADLTVPMGGMVNIGTTSPTVANVSCMGTLEMTIGSTVTATQSVNLSGCALQLDVPMGSMVAMDIPIIVNMSMMMNTGMFMGMPEGQPVNVGGMTRYITYVGGDGNDVMLLSMMPMPTMPTMPMMPMLPPAGTNVKDMWWSPYESGWGMSVVTHGDTPFVTLYIYDANGKPTWLVMPTGAWDATHTIYTGSVYAPSGAPFFSYDATRLKVGAAAGSVTLTFQDFNHAKFDYVIGGVSGFKLVTREVFADGAGMQQDRSDLWWGGMSQNGWGVTIRQLASTLFSVWYTYDVNGAPTWYVMPGGAWTDASTYEGHLYRTTGSAWVGQDYNVSKLQVFDAGTYRIRFAGDAASMDYTADGHAGSVPLLREPF